MEVSLCLPPSFECEFCAAAPVDRQNERPARIKVNKTQRGGGEPMKKQPPFVTCIFSGEEDVRQILLRSFRLYLSRSLARRGEGRG